MTYTMSFEGTLEFEDAQMMELALDGYLRECSRHGSWEGLGIDDFELREWSVSVQQHSEFPASYFESTQSGMYEMSSWASGGRMAARWDDGGGTGYPAMRRNIDRDTLPARHYRWEAWMAIERDDVEALRQLFARGLDPQAQLHVFWPRWWNRGQGLLHFALMQGSSAIVEELLGHGHRLETDEITHFLRNAPTAQALAFFLEHYNELSLELLGKGLERFAGATGPDDWRAPFEAILRQAVDQFKAAQE